MLIRLLEEIDRVDVAVERFANGDDKAIEEVRQGLRRLERTVVARCYVDGDVVVEDRHHAAALEIVTAYLDGASRGDDFQLLATVVGDRINRDGTEPSFVVALVAALAMRCGDLAGMVAPEAATAPGGTDRRQALATVQALAVADPRLHG